MHSNNTVSGVELYPGGWPSLDVVELDALAELVLRLGRLLLLLAPMHAGSCRVVSLRLSPRVVLGSRLSPLVVASKILVVVVVVW